jgi:hypothetical protein
MWLEYQDRERARSGTRLFKKIVSQDDMGAKCGRLNLTDGNMNVVGTLIGAMDRDSDRLVL